MLFFGFLTGIQYNDPDPLYWMMIYGGMALCGGWHFFGSPSRMSGLFGGALTVVALGWGAFLAPDLLHVWAEEGVMKLFSKGAMDSVRVDRARECVGLLFVLLAGSYELLHVSLAENTSSEE